MGLFFMVWDCPSVPVEGNLNGAAGKIFQTMVFSARRPPLFHAKALVLKIISMQTWFSSLCERTCRPLMSTPSKTFRMRSWALLITRAHLGEDRRAGHLTSVQRRHWALHLEDSLKDSLNEWA